MGTQIPIRQSAELLAAYGISVGHARGVTSVGAALVAAGEVGYPVALKAAGLERLARSEAGGVALDLQNDTDLAGAQAVADRIRAAVAGLDLRHQDNPAGRVTLSMGLYVGHPALADRNDPLAWVDVADRLLYEAKGAGRNRVVAREGHAAAA